MRARMIGTSSVRPSQPYTTDGMPTINSIAGLSTTAMRGGAISREKHADGDAERPADDDRKHRHEQRADDEDRGAARMVRLEIVIGRKQKRPEREVVDEERLRAFDGQINQDHRHREDDEARCRSARR